MTLHVHEWGGAAAPGVVCLHGVLAHGGLYGRLARERLTRFRVVAPDLRGHGRSPFEPPWDIGQHLEDVLAAAPPEARIFIGHSFGGRLALEVALRQPHRVERLVLLDPALRLQPWHALQLAEEHRTIELRDPPACRSAIVAAFGELSRRPPPYEAITCPVLLVRCADASVMGANRLRAFQEALGDRLRVVHVPGGHDVLLDAFEETADAVAEFVAAA